MWSSAGKLFVIIIIVCFYCHRNVDAFINEDMLRSGSKQASGGRPRRARRDMSDYWSAPYADGCDTDAGVQPADKLFRFVVHGVLLNGIAGAGLLGNALAALVLSRPQMRSSINCLLLGLAACDAVLLLAVVPLFGLTAVFPYTGRLRYYYYHVYPHITPYAYPIANAAQTMSVYLTVIVTAERWVAVYNHTFGWQVH